LQIALTVEGGQAVLTIADHGAGIAAADAERVFERFARGEGAPSGGAGLGLAIVKRVVDSHGGRIDLSNRPQGGLVATIRLPRSSHDPPVRHGRCPAAGPAGAGRAGRRAPLPAQDGHRAAAHPRHHRHRSVRGGHRRLPAPAPGTEVVYEDIITQDLYARYLHDRGGPASPDLLISSGMDLQTKLVNDGHALPHRSAQTAALPAWAQWRNEAFGISYEPVVMVYNTRALPAAKVPHTRRQLLDRLRAEGTAARQGRHL
jgi:hypothetical protein